MSFAYFTCLLIVGETLVSEKFFEKPAPIYFPREQVEKVVFLSASVCDSNVEMTVKFSCPVKIIKNFKVNLNLFNQNFTSYIDKDWC